MTQQPLFDLVAGVLAIADEHLAPGGYPAHWRVDDAPGGPAWFGTTAAIRDWVDAQASAARRKRKGSER